MDYFKINLFIVGTFLLISLIVGLWAGRKVTSIRDYALANKSYGTWPLVMTNLSTLIGGYWVFGRPKEICLHGIGTVLFIYAWAICMFLIAKYISPRMLPFRNCLTIGDVMGEMYGFRSKVITGILSIIFSSIIAGLNITCLGFVFEKFLGLNNTLGIIISTTVVSMYTFRGGIKSVTATDIVQFVLLISVLVVLAILTVNKVGGLETLLIETPSDKFQFWESTRVYNYLSLILLDLFFFSEIVHPLQMDRMLMAKSPSHMSKMLRISGIFAIIIVTIVAIITYASLILYPDIDVSYLTLEVINRIMPKWAQGLGIVGIIAIVFSTADSYILSIGVTLTHDILKPLQGKNKISFNELKWAKYSTVVGSLLAIWVALWGQYLFKLNYMYSLIYPILAAPMVFGILGIKPEKKAFWISSITASITLIFCMAADSAYHPIISGFALLISVCVSAITYMIVHIKLNKGIYIITNHGFNNPDKESYESKEKDILYQIVEFLLYPIYFAKRCRTKVSIYGTPPYVLFGALYLIVLVAPYFLHQDASSQYDDLMLVLRFIGILACALLMTESIWPNIMLKYLPAFWYMTLAYCLPFLSAMLLILTEGDTWYLINVSVSIIFLMFLADWKSVLSITVLGLVAALLFCKYGVGSALNLEELNFSFQTKYLLDYQLIFATVIGLLFVRRKQYKVETLKKRKMMIEAKYKLLKDQFYAVLSVEDQIAQGLGMREINMLERLCTAEKFCKNLMKYAPQEQALVNDYNEISQTFKYLENLSVQAKEYTKLNVSNVTMDLFLSSIDQMASLYSEDYSIVVRTETKVFECDAVKLSNLIIDALERIHTLNVDDDHVTVDIVDTEIEYSLPSLPNYKKRLKALQFTISTAYTLDNNFFPESYNEEFRNPKDILSVNEGNVDSIICQRIISAHFGISKNINDENGHTVILVIPVHLREIRPLPLDLEVPKEVIITWPGALELENELKKEIVLKVPKANMEKIEKAIDLIKKYHYHQNRHSGEPYYLHPVQVAMIELNFLQEEDAILGALLHDTLEDTALHIMDIKAMFGDRVAEIVLGVSKIDCGKVSKFHSNDEHLSTLDKKDIIIMTIKIADRLHNMRTLSGHKSLEKRRAIAQETLDFFVPLAKNLGLIKAYEELKDLSENGLK